MAKKFFSLIHEGRVHIAPDQKVIPAKEFSTMVNSKSILDQVKEDAKLYREEVTAECEALKEQAEKEGFEAGFSKWAEKLAELEEEIIRVRKDVEDMVVPVALKAAKKIVNQELTTSKKVILNIIAQSLKSVAQHKRVVIFVNKEDLNMVEKAKENLAKQFEALETFSVVPREDVELGGCIIETEGGIINAQLENQWLILENAFESLLKPAMATTSSEKEGSK